MEKRAVACVVLLLWIMNSAHSDLDPWVNITFVESQEAVCLDGSPAAYYWRKSDSPNWIVFLQGGGWCYGNGTNSCAIRSTTKLGSSKFWPLRRTFGYILSNSEVENPDFWNWNHVFIEYCDGSSFSGNMEEPIYGQNQTLLYHRGYTIWKVIMSNLLSYGLENAEKAVLMGCSAGGTATTLLCNNFRELLPRACLVKCLNDGGFFLDVKDIYGRNHIREVFDAVAVEHNITVGLERKYTYVNKRYEQLFPQYMIPYIQTPLFIVHATYDTWQMGNVLLMQDYSSCNNSQIAILEGFRSNLLQEINYLSTKDGFGMFIKSCFGHCELCGWNTTTINNKLILEAVGDWILERGVIQQIDGPPLLCIPSCPPSCEL